MRGSAAKMLSRYAAAAGFGEGEKTILRRKYLETPGPKRKAFMDQIKKEMDQDKAPRRA